jgi:hypothetical protein
VQIDTKPVSVVDETGEHLQVRVVIDPTATPGDRIVVVTTPYGSSSSVGSPANIITFFKPSAVANKGIPGPGAAIPGGMKTANRVSQDLPPRQFRSLSGETAVLPRPHQSAVSVPLLPAIARLATVAITLPLRSQWWRPGIEKGSDGYRGPPGTGAGQAADETGSHSLVEYRIGGLS